MKKDNKLYISYRGNGSGESRLRKIIHRINKDAGYEVEGRFTRENSGGKFTREEEKKNPQGKFTRGTNKQIKRM